MKKRLTSAIMTLMLLANAVAPIGQVYAESSLSEKQPAAVLQTEPSAEVTQKEIQPTVETPEVVEEPTAQEAADLEELPVPTNPDPPQEEKAVDSEEPEESEEETAVAAVGPQALEGLKLWVELENGDTSILAATENTFLLNVELSGVEAVYNNPTIELRFPKSDFVKPNLANFSLSELMTSHELDEDNENYIVRYHLSVLSTGTSISVPFTARLNILAHQYGDIVSVGQTVKDSAGQVLQESNENQYPVETYASRFEDRASPHEIIVRETDRNGDLLTEEFVDDWRIELRQDSEFFQASDFGDDKRSRKVVVQLPSNVIWNPEEEKNEGWEYDAAAQTITKVYPAKLRHTLLEWSLSYSEMSVTGNVVLPMSVVLINDAGVEDATTRREHQSEHFFKIADPGYATISKTSVWDKISTATLPVSEDYLAGEEKFTELAKTNIRVSYFDPNHTEGDSVELTEIGDTFEYDAIVQRLSVTDLSTVQFDEEALAKLNQNQLIRINGQTNEETVVATNIPFIEDISLAEPIEIQKGDTLVLRFDAPVTANWRSGNNNRLFAFLIYHTLPQTTWSQLENNLRTLIRNTAYIESDNLKRYSSSGITINEESPSLSMSSSTNFSGRTFLENQEATYYTSLRKTGIALEGKTLINPKYVVLVSDGIEIGEQRFSGSQDIEILDVEVVPNFNDTGQTAYIYSLNDLSYDAITNTSFGTPFTVRRETSPGINPITSWFSWENNDEIKAGGNNVAEDIYDLNENNNAADEILSYGTEINYVPARELIISKRISRHDEGVFVLDRDLKPDDQLDYELLVNNNSETVHASFTMYDILPYEGDQAISEEGNYVSRESEFRVRLTQPLEVLNPEKFQVMYSTDQPAGTYDDMEGYTWIPEAQVDNFEDVRMIRIALIDGQTIEANSSYRIRIPAADMGSSAELLNKSAYNTSFYTVNGRHIQSNRSRLTVTPYIVEGNVYKDVNSDSTRNDNEVGLGGYEVTLSRTVDGTTTEVATTTTDAQGNYRFDELLEEGNYSITFTLLADDTVSPQSPSTGTVIGSDVEADGTLDFTLTKEQDTRTVNVGVYTEYTPITTRFVNESNEEIAEAVSDRGLPGSSYTTIAKEIAGYELIETPENATGEVGTNPIEVVYVYRQLPESVTVTVTPIDEKGEPIEGFPSVPYPGPPGGDLTIEVPNIPGYERIDPDQELPTVYPNEDTEIEIEYIKITPIRVTFEDEAGNTLQTEQNTTQRVGTSYTTEGPETIELNGRTYELHEVRGTANGEVGYEDILVEYIYREVVQVNVTPVDENGEPIEGYPTENYPGTPGDELEVDVPEIPGYERVTPDEDIPTTYPDEDTNIEIEYIKITPIRVTYTDEDGNPLRPEENTTQRVNTDYETTTYETLEFEGRNYELIAVPENSSGTVGYDDILVEYVYREVVQVNVTPVDENGEPIEGYPTENYPGTPGDELEVDVPEIPGYERVTPDEDIPTTYPDEDTDIEIEYIKITPIRVTYTDEDGNPLRPEENTTQRVNTDYETTTYETLEFEGRNYELIAVPENSSGTVGYDDILVEYIYREVVQVNVTPVDENGDPIEGYPTENYPGTPGDELEVDVPEIPGYERVTPDEDIPTTYPDEDTDIEIEYIKITPIRVTFEDEEGNTLQPEENTTQRVNSTYETSGPATIELDGRTYELIAVPENATGTVGYDNIEVHYVYREVVQVNVTPVDENGDPIEGFPTVEYPGKPGNELEIHVPEIPGYELIEPELDLPTVYPNEDTDIEIEYIRMTPIRAIYQDELGNILQDEVNMLQRVRTNYETTCPEIIEKDGRRYEVIAIPENAIGVVGYDEIEVLYVYREIVQVNVTPVDENGDPIEGFPTTEYPGTPGDDLEITVPEIPGYERITPDEEIPGKFPGEDTNLEIEYVKVTPIKVTFTDEEGNVLQPEENATQRVNTKYETTGPQTIEVDGKVYELIAVPENAAGTVGYDDILVKYVYRLKEEPAPAAPKDEPQDKGSSSGGSQRTVSTPSNRSGSGGQASSGSGKNYPQTNEARNQNLALFGLAISTIAIGTLWWLRKKS